MFSSPGHRRVRRRRRNKGPLPIWRCEIDPIMAWCGQDCLTKDFSGMPGVE
jgi:hypothetical protein